MRLIVLLIVVLFSLGIVALVHRGWLSRCAWSGHEDILIETSDRMFLHCVSCGSDSAGFELNAPPPRVTVPGKSIVERIAT